MATNEATPAATVVIARDSADGVEVLMLHRNSAHAFGGMWVFPGGKIDPEDASAHDTADELTAARHAAVRETLEEAGVVLEPDRLVPISHWTPPPEAPRKFTTWFFVAQAPNSHDVVVNADEHQDHAWLSPADVLRRVDALEVELAPPTWMTLHEMSAYSDVASFVADVRAREPKLFATRVARAGDVPVAVWDGDAGYADGDLE